MQTKLSDGSVMICGILAKDAEYKQVGDKNSSLTKFSIKVGERPPCAAGRKAAGNMGQRAMLALRSKGGAEPQKT